MTSLYIVKIDQGHLPPLPRPSPPLLLMEERAGGEEVLGFAKNVQRQIIFNVNLKKQ
jgi:hypothetical protein